MQSQSALQCRSREGEREKRKEGGDSNERGGEGDRERKKGGVPEQKKKEGESKSKEGKMVLEGWWWWGSETEKGGESLRHPSVSPGTFLCTRNDCTREREQDLGRRGGGVVLKQLNEREGGRTHTWSTVQLTDSDHCSLSFFKGACVRFSCCNYLL